MSAVNNNQIKLSVIDIREEKRKHIASKEKFFFHIFQFHNSECQKDFRFIETCLRLAIKLANAYIKPNILLNELSFNFLYCSQILAFPTDNGFKLTLVNIKKINIQLQ